MISKGTFFGTPCIDLCKTFFADIKFTFLVPSPVDPPTIPQVDSRYLVVQWDEASEPNGVIVHYILYRNNTYRTTLANNVTRLRVTGLEPFTIYVFSVAACTVVGCSNSSLSLPVRTLEDGENRFYFI